MHQALSIAQMPRAEWAAAIDALPAACPNADCTGGIGCRERIADYLRIQWRMISAREARATRGVAA